MGSGLGSGNRNRSRGVDFNELGVDWHEDLSRAVRDGEIESCSSDLLINSSPAWESLRFGDVTTFGGRQINQGTGIVSLVG